MNILLLYYSIIDCNGRLIELYNIAKKLGDVTIVCASINKKNSNSEKFISLDIKKYFSLFSYFSFLIVSINTAKRMKNIDILLVDNYFAALVALIIKSFFKIKFVVQDVRELYFMENIKSWRGKLLIHFEIKLMRIANIVLCANNYRAEIMQNHYKLPKKPLIFENIRFFNKEYDKKTMVDKYAKMFRYKINIINTGGVSITRGTDILIKAMRKLPKDFGLFLVGGGREKDLEIIKEIIFKYGIKNVHIINKVPLDELKYIVQQCDIGIINYHMNDLNNKFCASGKVYEYLSEGLPIVTTENIPLKDFCNKTQTGVADKSFYKGILKISNNLEFYISNVNNFIKNISVDEYNKYIAKSIRGIFINNINI